MMRVKRKKRKKRSLPQTVCRMGVTWKTLMLSEINHLENHYVLDHWITLKNRSPLA
jgi:hypothetical protein